MAVQNRKMLVLCANDNDIPFICLARSMGFYVVTTGNAPSQAGHKYADEYIPFDYSDYDGITKMAKENHIDAVFEGSSDNCALTASYIADSLGLKGHDSFEVAETIHRKDKFKQFCKKNNIKSPAALIFESIDEALLSLPEEYPVIVKPTDMAGGKGVSIAQNEEEYSEAVTKAFSTSRSKKIVVEKYIKGTLHSMHCFIINQSVAAYTTGNDCSYANKFMTSYGIFPADNHARVQDELLPEIEKIAKLLNLADGHLDTQYMDDGTDLWIIEMMRRCPGSHTTELAGYILGIDWREWILRAVSGDNMRCFPESRNTKKIYGFYCAMGNKNGVLKNVKVDDVMKKYIYQYYQYKKNGFHITDYLYQKIGVFLFCFDTPEEKDSIFPRITEYITVEYE